MLKGLLKWIKQAGAKTESDSGRNGFLSYSGEVHAVGVGIYYGFVDFRDWGGLPEDYAKGKNIEPGHYPKAGYVVGAVLRVGLYLALGAGAISLL
jgi:hypothetical protein